MALKLIKAPNGEYRKKWYARVTDANGKQKDINLGVPVRGRRNTRKRGLTGNAAFLNSKAEAQTELDKILLETKNVKNAIRAKEDIVELITGEKNEILKISQTGDVVKSKGKAPHRKSIESRIQKFIDYIVESKGDVPLNQIKPEDIQTFLDAQNDSKETAKKRMSELRKLFREALPAGFTSPMKDVVMPEATQDDDTVPRSIFTNEQLKRIYETAKDHELYPLIVVAAGTGLRKGDVCTLKWESVKLKTGMIQVTKTRKTGKGISVAMSPRMMEVLKNQSSIGVYVFPKMADLYLSGKTGQDQIGDALKEILYKALAEEKPQAQALTALPPAEAYMKTVEAIDGMTTTSARKDRFKAVLRAYVLDGKTYDQIQTELDLPKSQISEAFKVMESETGIKLLRKRSKQRTERKARLTTTEIAGRNKRQSVYDWHSFRTTWVTRALESGWTIPEVRKVTGHATVEIVLKHYFKPDEEHMKALPLPASAAI
jgi:integrase